VAQKRSHVEAHKVTRLGWLRAAVLGANDGLLSTASLMIGVATADSGYHAVVVSGIAGLVAGAMSMAAGEYVSVSSQSDSEAADIARERQELRDDHARDELGISDTTAARPVEAALTSAASFAVGAGLPFLTALVTPIDTIAPAIAIVSLVSLAVLGAIGAKAGGAPMLKAAIRVAFWGALAMAVTAGIGTLFGARV
jgi:predicted membrane protein (TIGR00267 family)